MATTGFWPIRGSLKAALDYAENPDKTTASKFLDTDLAAALRYAENDSKTDERLYVGAINCSKYCAYEQMMAVKKRFGERGKNVAYHGFQSFATGEVSPEEAFEIGMETARRMWGDRYQVVVTLHLNTDNLHCHYVVNSSSFIDGKKFRDKIGDHLELRKISDEVCREHGLSVLENSKFYNAEKNEYEVERMELKQKISDCNKRLKQLEEMNQSKDKFLSAVRKFMEMKGLTPALICELIDHIDVYETEGTGKNRTQRIVIHYRFVGCIEIPDCPKQHHKANTRKGVEVEYLTA